MVLKEEKVRYGLSDTTSSYIKTFDTVMYKLLNPQVIHLLRMDNDLDILK